jgi:uncharacterized protein (DUF3820 family)
MNETAINTHNLRIGFGKHKGELWTRVPVSYLKWLVNTPAPPGYSGDGAKIAAAELARRGTATPTIEVSGHAIDRASLNCRKSWHQTSKKDEGIHAWLCRMADEALTHGLNARNSDDGSESSIEYHGLKFVFAQGEIYPSLKTVMPL